MILRKVPTQRKEWLVSVKDITMFCTGKRILFKGKGETML